MKMRPLEAIVDAFIMTVGITRPTQKKKHVATIFIASGLIGSILGAAAMLVFLISRLF